MFVQCIEDAKPQAFTGRAKSDGGACLSRGEGAEEWLFPGSRESDGFCGGERNLMPAAR